MNSSEWLRYLHDLNDYISCIWIWEQIMTLELVAIRMSILILSSLAPSTTNFYSTECYLTTLSSRNTLNLKPFRSRFHYATFSWSNYNHVPWNTTTPHPTILPKFKALNSFKMIQTQNSQFSQFYHWYGSNKVSWKWQKSA